MASPARFAALRQILDERLASLAPDLEHLFETELASRVSTEVEAKTARLAEALNQAVRRLRQAGGFEEAAAVLADSSASFCARAAIFENAGGTLKLRAARGVPAGLELPLERAPAFRTALETGDPVIALAADGEVSGEIVQAFGHTSAERVAVFPVGEAGFLYAWGEVRAAPLELLAQAAGALRPPRAAQDSTLVSIAPAPSRAGWAALDLKQQRLHLRAQQFARTEIAQIRLHRSERVKEGRQRADIYGVLGREIDAVREEFTVRFVAKSNSMVDYVHIELLRTLANDDAVLLGSGYPGPLV